MFNPLYDCSSRLETIENYLQSTIGTSFDERFYCHMIDFPAFKQLY